MTETVEPDDKPNKRGKAIDWEAVEKAFRGGKMSLRAIGKQFDVSEGAIRKRADKETWERDLSERVREKVRTELVRNLVRKNDPAYHASEREIVDTAAAMHVQVVRDHQKVGAKGMRTVQLLSDRLEEAIIHSDEIVQQIKDADVDGEKRKRMMRAVSLGSLVTIAANLGNAARTWISIEREAFNISGDGLPPPAPETPLTDMTEDEIDRRIAETAKEAGISLAAVRESAKDAGK